MSVYQPGHAAASSASFAVALPPKLLPEQWAWLRTTVTVFAVVTAVVGVYAVQPSASAPIPPQPEAAAAEPASQQLTVSHDVPVERLQFDTVAVVDLNAAFTAEEIAEIQALADEEAVPTGNPFGAATEYAEVLELLDNKMVQSPFHGSTYPPVTSDYGPRWGGWHYGTDYGAPAGTRLYPISYGIVTYQYTDSYGANVLTIDHMIDGERYRTLYAHMLDDVDRVEPGQIVVPNQVISEVGSTGFSTGPHLHLELMTDDASTVNPHAFLTKGEIKGHRDRDWVVDPNDNEVGLPPDYEPEPEGDADSDEPARPEDPEPSEEPSEEPEPSDPGPSDPGPSDPGPSDPGPSDPGPSEPGPSDPSPSEPGPSEPEPTQSPEPSSSPSPSPSESPSP